MPLPEIVLPAWAGKIGRILPAKPPQAALVATLNIMLKKGLLPADMTLFAGRKFEIDVLDAGIKVRFGANGEKFTADGFDGTLGLITKNLLDSVDWPFGEWFLQRGTPQA